MGYRIQNRRDTADRWAEMNPILLEGEMGLVTDNANQYKIGDGIHAWNDLPLRGFTGTISQELGEDENAVVSQKIVTEKLVETDEKLAELGSEVIIGEFELKGSANKTNYFKVKFNVGSSFSVLNLATSPCSIYLYNENKEVIEEISQGLAKGEVKTHEVHSEDVFYIGGYTSEVYNIQIFNVKSADNLKIEDNLDSINAIVPVFAKGIVNGVYVDAILNLKNNSLIAPNGTVSVLSSGADAFFVSDAVSISPYDKIEVQGTSQYKNCYFAIYDANGKVLVKEQGQDAITTKKFSLTAPAGAATIRVSWLGGTPSSYIKIAKVVENGKLWKGLKWVCFGDSLTEKNNGTANKRYYDFVSEELGITTLDYGKSGTGYFKTYGGSQNFLNRIEELADIDFDVITFFGSFNDLDGGWIGGSTDSTDTSSNNICGFINATLDRLYEIKPFVKVGIITPTPWYNSKTLVECSQYADALIEIAKKRGIPCLDLFRCSNLHPDKQNFREEFYKENGVQDNGTHPNSKGHKRIYPQFREFLKTML